jgi:hypothetical protein
VLIPDPLVVELQKLIEDTESLRNRSQAGLVKVWTAVTRRPETEFRSALGRLSHDWQARFQALPERPSAVA